eukprot:scaffold241019_cov29-Tisochrysis_lutea.AAC.1
MTSRLLHQELGTPAYACSLDATRQPFSIRCRFRCAHITTLCYSHATSGPFLIREMPTILPPPPPPTLIGML